MTFFNFGFAAAPVCAFRDLTSKDVTASSLCNYAITAAAAPTYSNHSPFSMICQINRVPLPLLRIRPRILSAQCAMHTIITPA